MRSNDSLKVIVVGISKTLDDAGLSEMFSAYGAVADAKVVLDATTKTSRGFGFVTFTAQSAMKKAIQAVDKTQVDGRTINVRRLVPKDKLQEAKESVHPEKKPCWMLRKGKCTLGANCPFSHDIKSGEFGSCFEFVQNGSCKRGDKCKFYHPPVTEQGEDESEHADQANPTASSEAKVSGKKEGGTEPRQRRVCYAFQKGTCHRGKKCLNLHELLSDPAMATKPIDTDASKSTEAISKKRRRPSVDDTAHPAESKVSAEPEHVVTEKVMNAQQPRQKKVVQKEDKPCRFFQQGKCTYGASCKFQHVREEASNSNTAPSIAARVVTNESDDANESNNDADTPLQALADHVAKFMASHASTSSNAESQPKSVKHSETSSSSKPPAKKQRVQADRIDMGAAFDGVSDDDAAPSKPVDKAQMERTRENFRSARRTKKQAKRAALSRLKQE